MDLLQKIFLGDSRRVKIVAAAYEAFCNYGFKRTSMDDIAKGAGVSRPALYQIFANKTEIFSAAVEEFFEGKKVASEEVFAQKLTALDTLEALVDISVLAPCRSVAQTPHGLELLGMKTELCSELFTAWADHSRETYKQALLLTPDLSPQLADDLTNMLMNALEGAKSQPLTMEELGNAAASILRVVEAALPSR